MKNGVCLKCQSKKVIRGLQVRDLGHSNYPNALSLAITEQPKSFFSRFSIKAYPLRAMVCAQCGYTELYVGNPQGFAKSFRKYIADLKESKNK